MRKQLWTRCFQFQPYFVIYKIGELMVPAGGRCTSSKVWLWHLLPCCSQNGCQMLFPKSSDSRSSWNCRRRRELCSTTGNPSVLKTRPADQSHWLIKSGLSLQLWVTNKVQGSKFGFLAKSLCFFLKKNNLFLTACLHSFVSLNVSPATCSSSD